MARGLLNSATHCEPSMHAGRSTNFGNRIFSGSGLHTFHVLFSYQSNSVALISDTYVKIKRADNVGEVVARRVSLSRTLRAVVADTPVRVTLSVLLLRYYPLSLFDSRYNEHNTRKSFTISSKASRDQTLLL